MLHRISQSLNNHCKHNIISVFLCLNRVKKTLSEVDNLKSGDLVQPLIQHLQEVCVRNTLSFSCSHCLCCLHTDISGHGLA